MKTFLDKLDRKAGRWLEAVDREFQQPVTKMLTGEVFTSGADHAPYETRAPEQAAVQRAPSAHRRPAGECGAARCSEAW